MKKSIAKFLCIVCTLMMSCSSDNEIFISEKAQVPKRAKEINKDLQERYQHIEVERYISEYPDVFGTDVMIFNSEEEAEYFLSKMTEVNTEELIHLYQQMPIKNEIIESNIIYDVLLEETGKELFGINLEETEITDREKLDVLYKVLYERLQRDYPRMCHQDAEGNIYTHPLGRLGDITSICNDKHIVIIDKVVYRLEYNFILTCPIDKYVLIPLDMKIQEIWERYNVGELPHDISSDEDISMARIPALPAQKTEYEDLKSHIVSKGGYKLSVYITSYPYWAWGSTNICSKLIIDNYYNGNSAKCDIYGKVHIINSVYFPNKDITKCPDFTFTPKLVNGRYKSKTIRLKYFGSFYCPTRKTVVDYKTVDINITQNQNLQVKYTY